MHYSISTVNSAPAGDDLTIFSLLIILFGLVIFIKIKYTNRQEKPTVTISPSADSEIGHTPDMKPKCETPISILQCKIKKGDFDVFLCHNNEDKVAVKDIGNKLKERGILPWLDEWECRPGLQWQPALEQQIGMIKSAAVFVGKNDIGPWQQQELNAFLREFVNRHCPVIPVILPDAAKNPELPVFLKSMTWVDFRKDDPDPMEQLIWGIKGSKD